MFFPVKYLPGGSAIPEKTASQLSFVKVIVVGKPGKRVLLPGGASDSASLFAHFPEKHLRKKWCKNVTSALVVVYLQQLNTYKKNTVTMCGLVFSFRVVASHLGRPFPCLQSWPWLWRRGRRRGEEEEADGRRRRRRRKGGGLRRMAWHRRPCRRRPCCCCCC